MNSRCDTDPLDAAADVCDICGGEFCEACLLWPRGRNKPAVCKPCAIKSSGIRGTSKPERVMSRRDANRRREIILQTKDSRGEAGFVFFDDVPDYVALRQDHVAMASTSEPEHTRRRISFGRRKHLEEPAAEDRTPVAECQEPDEETARAVASPLHDDPFDPTTTGQEPASATEMLALIRSHTATSDSPLTEAQPSPAVRHSGPFTGALGTIPTSGAGFDPNIDPFSLQVDPFDIPSALPIPPPVPPPVRPPVRPPLPTATPSADVDALGNWIPPLLRGMAPPEERERESLPQRHLRN